ncbi:MAG: 4-hydroxy-3-methylbut-2-enyl diphosphate reductase [Acidobacteriota bacterium]
MKIYTADEAGFCFGVKRALNIIDRLHESNESIEIYGQLIHNNTVLKNLKEKGIDYIDDLKFQDENRKLIIRTHGILRSDEEFLKKKKISYVDATCPLVKKIHRIIEQVNGSKNKILIIGNSNHPEIRAISSYAKNGLIVNSVEELDALKHTESVSVVAQTTLDSDFFKMMISEIIDRVEHIEIFNTICSATIERQEAVKKIAPMVDFVIVIGGKNSSNTKKLYNISKIINENTFHIEKSSELNDPGLQLKFRGFSSVGITAGASTPPEEIEDVKVFFRNFKTEKES